MPAADLQPNSTLPSTTVARHNPDILHVGALHNQALNQQNPDLLHIGAVHNHSCNSNTWLDPNSNRIRLEPAPSAIFPTIDVVRTSATSQISANTWRSLDRNGNVNRDGNLQLPTQALNTTIPPRVPAGHHGQIPHTSELETQSMQRWRAESDSDQAWHAFGLGRSGHNEK
jgi:hypothetical protein